MVQRIFHKLTWNQNINVSSKDDLPFGIILLFLHKNMFFVHSLDGSSKSMSTAITVCMGK